MDYKFIQKFNNKLSEKGLTIAFAESITAGMIASSVAGVSGASSVLKGGIVTYDQKVKKQLLNVKQETLDKYTAESIQTSEEMVHGLEALNLGAEGEDLGAKICVAITGVASAPTTDYIIDKKIGDIFLSIKYKGFVANFINNIQGERNEIREKAVQLALDKVLDVIEKDNGGR